MCRSGIFSWNVRALLSNFRHHATLIYTMKRHYYTFIYLLPLIAVAGLFFMFSLTNPLSAGPGGILLVFFLAYLLCASSFFIILHGGIGLIARIINKHRKLSPRTWQIGVKKSYYIASVLAFGPVLLLAMQSVGQLQFRDTILVTVFLIIAVFYVIKRI